MAKNNERAPQRTGGHGGHGPGMGMAVEKPQHFWKTTGRLLRYLSPWMVMVVLVLIMAGVSVVLQINAPKVLGKATTEIFAGVMKGQAQMKAGIALHTLPINFTKIIHILATVGILYGLSALFSFAQQAIMTQVSQRAVYQMRKDFKAKLQRVPVSYYDTHSNGDVMSRMSNDMDNISGTLQQSLTQLVTKRFPICWCALHDVDD